MGKKKDEIQFRVASIPHEPAREDARRTENDK